MRSGLLLPSGVIQPFDLSFEPDDLHVMAYLQDHPRYEAIEAMIRLRTDGAPLVRAIITRHDQSQVDHTNDPRQLRSSARRERCERAFECRIEELPEFLRVSLRFESFANEDVSLEITSLGKPGVRGAGLSDPGRHSLNSSLPLMYRGRSALASPQTRIEIGGKPFAVPVQIEAARPIAMRGYVTELHHMAALRAGTTQLEIIESPGSFAMGERWVYASGDDQIAYTIVAAVSSVIEVVRSDTKVEAVRARVTDAGLELAQLSVRHPDDESHCVRLDLAEAAFSIAIDDANELMNGRYEVAPRGDFESVVRLWPEAPAWARARPVSVTLKPSAGRLSISTEVGP